MNPNKIINLLEELSKMNLAVHNERLLALLKLKEWESEVTCDLQAKIKEYEKVDEAFDKTLAEVAEFKANGGSVQELIKLRAEIAKANQKLEDSKYFRWSLTEVRDLQNKVATLEEYTKELRREYSNAKLESGKLRNALLRLISQSIMVNDFAESTVSYYPCDDENRKHAIQRSRELIREIQVSHPSL